MTADSGIAGRIYFKPKLDGSGSLTHSATDASIKSYLW